MINPEEIAAADKIVVQDGNKNVLVGPAMFGPHGDLQVFAFGQRLTVARTNRAGKLRYIEDVRIVGHQPPLELVP